jgi:hypothetical protein
MGPGGEGKGVDHCSFQVVVEERFRLVRVASIYLKSAKTCHEMTVFCSIL